MSSLKPMQRSWRLGRAAQNRSAAAEPTADRTHLGRTLAPVVALADPEVADANTDSSPAAAGNPHESKTPARDRVRLWRRRVLLRRGARMHVVISAKREECMLAMLDEEGLVVSWYGPADGSDSAGDQVVDRHVSQFYVPDDIACEQPLRDLRAATVGGSSIRQGWHRRPDGSAFWGTTVIEAVMLRDGRVQGFSYVTHASAQPSVDSPIARHGEPALEDLIAARRPGTADVAILPAWDRTARSCGVA